MRRRVTSSQTRTRLGVRYPTHFIGTGGVVVANDPVAADPR